MTLDLIESADASQITCALPDGTSLLDSGRDLFDAFTNLRRRLEARGWQLLCKGARPDAFPSGMSRDMSGGRKVYETTIGQPAKFPMVDIFEYECLENVGKVADQELHHRAWIDSMKDLVSKPRSG